MSGWLVVRRSDRDWLISLSKSVAMNHKWFGWNLNFQCHCEGRIIASLRFADPGLWKILPCYE
jgi:hypothetical protein